MSVMMFLVFFAPVAVCHLTVIVPLRRVGCWLLTGALYGVLWQLLPSVADDVAVVCGRTLLGLEPFCFLELVELRKEAVVVPSTSTCLEAVHVAM